MQVSLENKSMNKLLRAVYKYGPVACLFETQEGVLPMTFIATNGIADADELYPKIVLIACIGCANPITFFLKRGRLEKDKINKLLDNFSDHWCENIISLLNFLTYGE